MKSFENKIAVVTGGGTGMGRELVLQLAKENCNISMCDVIEENMEQTMDLATSINPSVKITKHVCDVSIKDQVEKFTQVLNCCTDYNIIDRFNPNKKQIYPDNKYIME